MGWEKTTVIPAARLVRTARGTGYRVVEQQRRPWGQYYEGIAISTLAVKQTRRGRVPCGVPMRCWPVDVIVSFISIISIGILRRKVGLDMLNVCKGRVIHKWYNRSQGGCTTPVLSWHLGCDLVATSVWWLKMCPYIRHVYCCHVKLARLLLLKQHHRRNSHFTVKRIDLTRWSYSSYAGRNPKLSTFASSLDFGRTFQQSHPSIGAVSNVIPRSRW